MSNSAVPKKGDIVLINLDPQSGHEQAGFRPALVVSPEAFNQLTGFCVIVPVTNQVKGYPFELQITGTEKTTGVALLDQFKSIDYRARGARVVDRVGADCLEKAVAITVSVLEAK